VRGRGYDFRAIPATLVFDSQGAKHVPSLNNHQIPIITDAKHTAMTIELGIAVLFNASS
jgi:hypothetical protein